MSLHPSVLRERITLDEWASLDEEVRGEFVDGALVEEEVPGTVHEVLVSWLVVLLGTWGDSERALVLASGLKLIVSSRRDRVDKLAEYAAFGVRWYWLVDPGLRSLEILELGADGRYVHAVAATSGRLEQVPGCPGLVIDLDAAWKRVDAYLAEATP